MQRATTEDVRQLMGALDAILQMARGTTAHRCGAVEETARLAIIDQHRREITRQSRPL